IERNLKEIRDAYLEMSEQTSEQAVNISTKTSENGNATSLYVSSRYLMDVTSSDADMQGMTTTAMVQNVKQAVTEALQQAIRQRQPAYLRQAGVMATGATGGAIALALALQLSRYLIFNWGVRWLHGQRLEQLSENQSQQLHAIRYLLLPLIQLGVLLAAVLWSLSLFPQTRPFQNNLLSWLKIPIAVAIIAVVASIGVRVSYLLIDRFVGTLRDRSSLDFENHRRSDLRVSTISSVIKNIANFVWLVIGLVIALALFGIDIGVLLASFGIIGLALSLAMQNLIKGAVTGFFILLEDQYAIGDIVKIDDDAGLVENMNLRITQLRDAGGRLITIPTSDIDRVANYSLHWSRCDLKLPVSYQADIDNMIQLAQQVGNDLRNDDQWRDLILEDPNVLGVEDFEEDAIVLRVWIKTQPLKQWDVSREFRRRYKQALESAETSNPFPQRQVLFNTPDGVAVSLSGKLQSFFPDSPENGLNGQGDRANASNLSSDAQQTKTDRQPRNIGADSEAEASKAEDDG
ncbi:MAG: mechanosensitive ion channel family protein, partial [Phormidesmis sp.]